VTSFSCTASCPHVENPDKEAPSSQAAFWGCRGPAAFLAGGRRNASGLECCPRPAVTTSLESWRNPAASRAPGERAVGPQLALVEGRAFSGRFDPFLAARHSRGRSRRLSGTASRSSRWWQSNSAGIPAPGVAGGRRARRARSAPASPASISPGLLKSAQRPQAFAVIPAPGRGGGRGAPMADGQTVAFAVAHRQPVSLPLLEETSPLARRRPRWSRRKARADSPPGARGRGISSARVRQETAGVSSRGRARVAFRHAFAPTLALDP